MKLQNILWLGSIYLVILGTLSLLLINNSWPLFSIIAAVILISTILLFVFLLIINFIQIRYLPFSKYKMSTRRQFNITLDQFRYHKKFFKFLYLKTAVLDSTKDLENIKEVLNFPECLAYYFDKNKNIYLIINDLNKVLDYFKKEENNLKNIKIYTNYSKYLP